MTTTEQEQVESNEQNIFSGKENNGNGSSTLGRNEISRSNAKPVRRQPELKFFDSPPLTGAAHLIRAATEKVIAENLEKARREKLKAERPHIKLVK